MILRLLGVTVLVSLVTPAPASESVSFLKLKDSRDALLTQQRAVQKSFDEVAMQIDELRKRQAILDAYLRQIDRSIRDVDGAMAQMPH